MKNIASLGMALGCTFAVGLGLGNFNISMLRTVLVTINAILATANLAFFLHENSEAEASE